MPRFTDQAGNVWEAKSADDPNPVLVQPAQGGTFIPEQADPTAAYQAPQAAADLARTRASTVSSQVDASVKQATAPAEITKAQADARKAQAEAEKIESGRDMLSATERANAITGYQSALALEGIIADLERKYKDGPGATKGVMGGLDYLPREANQRFDNAANAARGIVGQALGFTGGQLNSEGEAKMNVGPYIPSSSDKDGTIEDAIQRLRDLQTQAMNRSIAILGGRPDENGNITPVAPQERANALTYLRTDGGRGPAMEAAGYDATEKAVEYPPQFVAEHDALVQRLMSENGGRLDPNVYAREKAALAGKYGFGTDTATDAGWASDINGYLDGGGATVPTGMQPAKEKMSFGEQAWNRAASSEMGAGLAGYLNSFGMGAPEMLTGGNMDKIREANPGSAIVGEIGGAIGGTSLLGKAGQGALKLAGRKAPESAFMRNAITDTTYGGIYGGMTEGDPLTGAALGAVGSAGGQAIGKGLETGIGGVRASAPVQRLREAGVQLTPGRILGEGASRLEDKMVSWPLVGDAIRNRQQEGFRQFNEAAFREGGAPIGATPNAVGEEGIGQLRSAVSGAYDNATAGSRVPFDQPFMDDMQQVYNTSQRMPYDRQNALGEIIDARVAHMVDAGEMTGRDYQQAMRALKGNRSKVPGQFDGFEQEYRDAMTGTMDALDGTMRRGGGDGVIAGLDAANAANKNLNILENASLDKAKIGSQTGEAEVFLPSQLIAAARQSERKYGPSKLKDFGKAGQEVLPSTVPNSGTTDRALIAGLGLGGVGGVGEFASQGDVDTTATGLATTGGVLGALALLNSRRGAQAFERIALDRPDSLKKVAESLRRKRGLFGSAAVPIALTAQ